MGAADIRLRMATQDDAQTVASIITTVSEGVIEYLLGDLLLPVCLFQNTVPRTLFHPE